jgi:hypothetical protein
MSTTLDYLIPDLRFRIGDTDPAAYRYTDAWLLVALEYAIKKLYRYYSPPKYLIDTSNVVSRNPSSPKFTTEESTEGTIEVVDEPIIVLLAAIATLGGSLESSAWNIVSWKDAEIAYNNNESGRVRADILKALQAELDQILLSPVKRLATADKQSLPGYKGNAYERDGEL